MYTCISYVPRAPVRDETLLIIMGRACSSPPPPGGGKGTDAGRDVFLPCIPSGPHLAWHISAESLSHRPAEPEKEERR